MTPRLARKQLALAAVALALLGALAFLFAKTQSTGYKADMRALSLLRELSDMDARWDLDAQRVSHDLSARPAAAADGSAVVARIFQELGQVAAADARIPALRQGLARKEAAIVALREAHGVSLRALGRADERLGALALAAAAARARDPGSVGRVATLFGQVERLRAGIRAPALGDQAAIVR
ncbi:MAG TPA: hypothetical protein VLC53_16555, partial [Myxococcota bacterium]|nr:hypothetical protein [Myxococcota bacterium]